MYSRDFWKRRDKCTRFSFLKKKKENEKGGGTEGGSVLHEDAHEADRCVRSATREREGDDRTTENDGNLYIF